MRTPRGLSAAEREVWEQVAKTVVPLQAPPPPGEVAVGTADGGGGQATRPCVVSRPLRQTLTRLPPPPKGEELRPLDRSTLDATWDRRLSRGLVTPDFTLDLHGHGLDAAWHRLDGGLALALAQRARVVLVVAGKPRPADAADRGTRRGAIRAKLLDWLAAGPHASQIAAVRPAHPRHGGAGAVYVVLRKGR